MKKKISSLESIALYKLGKGEKGKELGREVAEHHVSARRDLHEGHRERAPGHVSMEGAESPQPCSEAEGTQEASEQPFLCSKPGFPTP